MKFVEVLPMTYSRGGYLTTSMLISLDNIARVIECEDDYYKTNIVTKDGKIYTLNEKFSDVKEKIRECESADHNEVE